MPYEDFIYYGDSAHAPYGTKEPEQIRELTFHVVEHLLDRGIKGLAIACNTATSAAVRYLRQMYPDLPLVGIERGYQTGGRKKSWGHYIGYGHAYDHSAGKISETFSYIQTGFKDCAGALQGIDGVCGKRGSGWQIFR